MPPAVLREMAHPNAPPSLRRFAESPPDWLRVRTPGTVPFLDILDDGEAEAISLAVELKAQRLLIDERDGAARPWHWGSTSGVPWAFLRTLRKNSSSTWRRHWAHCARPPSGPRPPSLRRRSNVTGTAAPEWPEPGPSRGPRQGSLDSFPLRVLRASVRGNPPTGRVTRRMTTPHRRRCVRERGPFTPTVGRSGRQGGGRRGGWLENHCGRGSRQRTRGCGPGRPEGRRGRHRSSALRP